MNHEELSSWRLRIGLPAAVPNRRGPPKGDISANKIRLLDRCKQAYAFSKIDKLESKVTDAKIRGSAIHHVLETVARPRIHGHTAEKPNVRELEVAFAKAAATFKLRTHTYNEAWSLVKELADTLDFSNTIAVEENWEIKFDSDAEGGMPFTAVGAFDRIDVKDGVVEIHDYKSGANVKSVAELRDDPQSLLYAAFVRLHWNGPIRLIYHFLGAEISVPFDAADLGERGLSLAKSKMAEIRAMETYPASTGGHCVDCDFRTDCPAYAAMAKTKTAEAEKSEPPVAASNEDLLRERQRYSTLARLFEDHRKTCDKALRARIELEGKVVGGGLRARLVSRIQRELPDDLELLVCKISESIEADPEAVSDQIGGISERKLKRFMASLEPDQRKKVEAVLDDLKEFRDTVTYVDVRPITGGF